MNKITQEELNEVLRLHYLWVEDDKKGKRANLCGYDLSGLSFKGANCSYIDFSYANCENANFSYADCQRACFYKANFSDANCQNAYFFNADFYNAYFDFKGVEFDPFKANLEGTIK